MGCELKSPVVTLDGIEHTVSALGSFLRPPGGDGVEESLSGIDGRTWAQ